MSNPDFAAQLAALNAKFTPSPFGLPGLSPGLSPGLPPTGYPGATMPAQFVTADQVNAMIEGRLKALAPVQPAGPDLSRLHVVLQQVDDLARRALPDADYKALHGYLASCITGERDFGVMLKSEALFPIMQLLWETIRENQG